MATETFKVDLGQLPILLHQLPQPEARRVVLEAWAASIKGRVSLYAPVRRRPQPPKTDRQRRFLHWAIATGLITIPYPRTGTMKRAWKTTVTSNKATVSNASAAAHFTKGRQSRYHAGNWTTIPSDLKSYGEEAKNRAFSAYQAWIRSLP